MKRPAKKQKKGDKDEHEQEVEKSEDNKDEHDEANDTELEQDEDPDQEEEEEEEQEEQEEATGVDGGEEEKPKDKEVALDTYVIKIAPGHDGDSTILGKSRVSGKVVKTQIINVSNKKASAKGTTAKAIIEQILKEHSHNYDYYLKIVSSPPPTHTHLKFRES